MSSKEFREFLRNELPLLGWEVKQSLSGELIIRHGTLDVCVLSGAEFYNPSFRPMPQLLTAWVHRLKRNPYIEKLLIVVISQHEEMANHHELNPQHRFCFLYWRNIQYLRLLQDIANPAAPATAEETAWLENAISKSAPLCRQFSNVERRRGNIPSAIQWAERSTAIDLEDPNGYNLLLDLYLSVGDLDLAADTAKSALYRARRDANTLRLMSDVSLRRGDLQQALALAKESVFEDSENALCQHHLAWVYYKSGDRRAARLAAEQAIRRAPTNPHFKRRLATILSEK